MSIALFSATPALAAPQTSIAMHGEPKNKDAFSHFSYVNPTAPKGGTLRLGVVGSFDSLHPFIVRGTVPQAPAFGLFASASVYESLMARSWDEPFSLYALLAQSIDVPEDRSAITFHLNPAARFSDGTPVTAEDVLFSYRTLREQGRPNHRTYYKKVETAEKIAERSVRFTFKKQENGAWDREMPLIMALMPVLPAQDWADRPFNQTTLRPPIASGPYRITVVDAGRSVTLSRNPDYWGRALPATQGLYNFDTVRIDFYRDDSVALQAFKAGAFDLRREPDPKKWKKAYAHPALADGRLKQERFAHQRTEALSGFIMNTRRPLLADPALRHALSLAFDFGWINRTLFQGLYKRSTSFFPNSELAAPPLPDEAESEILKSCLLILEHNEGAKEKPPSPCGRVETAKPFRGGVNDLSGTDALVEKQNTPPRKTLARFSTLPQGEGDYPDLLSFLLTNPVMPPQTDGSEEARRAQLLKAAEILKNAGYTLRDEKLLTSKGEPVAFEIMLSDPMEEKVALEWSRTLGRLGIAARVRTVDSAQYQARLNGFDYDVTTGRWFNSLSPGNEQMFFWSCAAAGQNGSRNYAGICDPAIDALAAAIPEAKTREALVATTRALDRLLMAGHYVVPFYHLGADQVAYWTTKLDHPSATPTYGPILESWWGRKEP